MDEFDLGLFCIDKMPRDIALLVVELLELPFALGTFVHGESNDCGA